MSYIRVIPRDLFNEANLLKCYGKVYLNLENLQNCVASFDDDNYTEFDVDQRCENGALFIRNVSLVVKGRVLTLTRPLNSRREWPLYAEDDLDPDFEPIEVFDDNGNFTEEMRKLCQDG